MTFPITQCVKSVYVKMVFRSSIQKGNFLNVTCKIITEKLHDRLNIVSNFRIKYWNSNCDRILEFIENLLECFFFFVPIFLYRFLSGHPIPFDPHILDNLGIHFSSDLVSYSILYFHHELNFKLVKSKHVRLINNELLVLRKSIDSFIVSLLHSLYYFENLFSDLLSFC